MVAKQFNRSIHTYDQHAIVQKKMAERMVSSLPKTAQPLQILDVGCGTGTLTQYLLDHFPQAKITALDIAEAMVNKAKNQVKSRSRVKFVVGDIEKADWLLSDQYDLIVSNAVFQWLEKPKETISRLAHALKPKGKLVVSTFGPDTFHELEQLFWQVEKQMGLSPGNHRLPLHPAETWQSYFQQAGLQGIKIEQDLYRLEYPDCLHFLRSIKAVGASYSENKHPLITTKKLVQEVMKKYDSKYQTETGVYTTYHVVQMCGQKKDC